MAMESLKWAWRKARVALSSIGSISFSGTDRHLFGHLSWSTFGSFNDAGNQLLASQTELQRRHALEQDLEAGAAVTAERAELQAPPAHAPTPDLEAAAEDTAVSNSSGGGDGEGRARRWRGPTAVTEEARVSNTSNSKTIGELAVPMLGCMGIYSTIHGDEQLQQLHPSLYFPLLTFLASGAYAILYSVFYALVKPTAGEGGGGGGGGGERELAKREWLKVALTYTGLALSFRVALGLY